MDRKFDPLDFSPNEEYSQFFNAYYCTKCDQYMPANCTPDLMTPRILEHSMTCLKHMWWTDRPWPIDKFRKIFDSLTEVARMAVLIKFFKRLDGAEVEQEISQDAINQIMGKIDFAAESMATMERKGMSWSSK